MLKLLASEAQIHDFGLFLIQIVGCLLHLAVHAILLLVRVHLLRGASMGLQMLLMMRINHDHGPITALAVNILALMSVPAT